MNTNNVVADVNGTVVEQNDRGWKTVFVDNRLVHDVAKPNSPVVEISITCKTRFSQFAETIPDSLYAPIVYQLQQQVKLNKSSSATMEQQNLLKESKFLLARVSCLFEENKKEVLKDGKPIMSGALEVALTGSSSDVNTKKKMSEDTLFEGTTKIKFNDSSYNHNKKSFVWQISYFLPQDLLNPVLILQSAEFKVFARKKQEKQKEGKTGEKAEKTNKKRKTMEESVIVEDTPEPKKLDNNASMLTMNTENQHIWSKHFDPRGQADGLRSVLQVKATSNNGFATVQQDKQNLMNSMFDKSYSNSQTEQQPSKIRRLMTTANPLTSTAKQNEILIPSTKQQLIKVEDPSVEIIDLDNETNEDEISSKEVQEFSSKLQELISVNRKLDKTRRCKLLELAVTEILKESASVDQMFSCKLMFNNLQKMVMANAGLQMAFNPM